MCRLFGLVCSKEVDIHYSMLEARNSFRSQAASNPDGWGIGWFENSKPKIKKYGENAFRSQDFANLSAQVRSKIFIAHVRYASISSTAGKNKNSHPFLYDDWIFAHNGTINGDRINKLLSPPYSLNLTSDRIDSEIYFRFIMQNIYSYNNNEIGIKYALEEVLKDERGANFLMSDGGILIAGRFDCPLFYLLRDPLSPLSAVSSETKALYESKMMRGEKAILIATEKLTKDEEWVEINNHSILIIDNYLNLTVISL